MTTKFFDGMIMLRFLKTKVATEEFCRVKKEQSKFVILMFII